MRSYLFAALPVLALAGCGQQASQPPVTTNAPSPALSAGPASKAPEPTNSLPDGAQTNAPLTSSAGNINNTQVGPSTPTRRARPRTTGY